MVDLLGESSRQFLNGVSFGFWDVLGKNHAVLILADFRKIPQSSASNSTISTHFAARDAFAASFNRLSEELGPVIQRNVGSQGVSWVSQGDSVDVGKPPGRCFGNLRRSN